jgi:hypothetical protein
MRVSYGNWVEAEPGLISGDDPREEYVTLKLEDLQYKEEEKKPGTVVVVLGGLAMLWLMWR